MALEAQVLSDLQALIGETKKKNPQTKEAAETGAMVLRYIAEHGGDVVDELSKRDEVVRPFVMGCDPKNPKAALISVTSIQKLVSQKALPQSAITGVLNGMKEVMDVGFEVDLKILQALLPLTSNFQIVTGDVLGEVLQLCLKLNGSKHPVVSGTAAATARQIVVFLFEKFSREPPPKTTSTDAEGVPLTPGKKISMNNLSKAQRDAFMTFQDLCLLTNGDPPEWLKVQTISRVLGFELIESVLEAHARAFLQVPEFSRLIKDRVCPLVIRSFSDKTSFPLTSRLLRVIIVLIRDLHAILMMETEIFLTMLIKTCEGDSPIWLRVLSLESLKAIVSQIELLQLFHKTYDKSLQSSHVLKEIVTTISRIVTHQAPGKERQSFVYSPAKIQFIDQLDKSEIPTINENYLPSLALLAVLTLAKSISYLLLPGYPAISILEHPEIPKGSNSPFLTFSPREPVDPEKFKESQEIVDICWKPILTSISFGWLNSNTEDLNHFIAEVYLNFIPLCHVLGHIGARDLFTSSLTENMVPLKEDQKTYELNPNSLTERNFEAFQVLFRVIQYLGNEFESTWFIILEALQILDRIVRSSPLVTVQQSPRTPVAKSHSGGLSGTFSVNVSQVKSMSQDDNLNLITNSVDRLFIEAGFLPDKSFKNFILALCQLLDESFESSAKLAVTKSKLPSEKKPFAIDKIQKTSLCNIKRILNERDSSLWDLLVDQLCKAASGKDGMVRASASDTLTEMIKTTLELQDIAYLEKTEELQMKFLRPLKNLVLKPAPDIQEKQLLTLYQLLQNSGHYFALTWEYILEILEIASNQEINDQNNMVIKAGFQSLQLVCTDFLSFLPVPCLHRCIQTLGQFAIQKDDLNISLTTISLIWNVADFVRVKRTSLLEKLQSRQSSENESVDIIDALWLALLSEVGKITADGRPEVRNGAIQSLFRVITLNGMHFKPSTWHACLWKIVFPLLDNVKVGSAKSNDQGVKKDYIPIVVHHSRNTAEKQWDETRVLSFSGAAKVFHEYFSVLMTLDGFKRAWLLLLEFFEEFSLNCGQEVVVASIESFKEVLEFPKKSLGEERLEDIREFWKDAWVIWEKVGLGASKIAGFTQDMFFNFLKSFENIYRVLETTFTPRDLKRLLNVLKGFLTYAYADVDYLRDAQNLTRLQALAFTLMEKFSLESKPVRSVILLELIDFMNLPYQKTVLGEAKSDAPVIPIAPISSYISFSVVAMDKLVEHFTSYVQDESMYKEEIFDKIITGFGVPMNLKYRVDAVTSKKQFLWKLATKSFLLVIKAGLMSLNTIQGLSADISKRVWKRILEVFSGYLLFKTPAPSQTFPIEQIEEDEKFDVFVVNSIKTEVVPLMSQIPVDFVLELVGLFQQASALNSSVGTVSRADEKEPVVAASRSLFSCACLGCVFALCSTQAELRNFPDTTKQIIADVAAEIMVERSTMIIRTYFQAKALAEQIPSRKVQSEELVFVLNELLKLDLFSGALKIKNIKEPIKGIVDKGKNSHLFLFYPSVVKLLSSEDRNILKAAQLLLARVGNELGIDAETGAQKQQQQ